jgi:hypothetical protein
MDFDQEYLKAKIMKSGDQPLDMRLDADGVMRYYLPEAEVAMEEAPAPAAAPSLPEVVVTGEMPKPAKKTVKPPVSPKQGQLDLGAMGVLKTVGEMIQSGAEKIDFDVLGLPGIGTLTLKDLTVGNLGKVLVDIAEGFPPVTGSGQTLSPTMESAELINLAPAAGLAYKGGKKVAKSLAPAAGEMLATYAEKTGITQFALPRVDSIERFPLGPTSIKPKVIAENKPLYRETNVDGLTDLLREDRQFTYANVFVTDNADIALGQGVNKGVTVKFRPNSVSGEESKKPMTGNLAGREYKADVFAPKSIESITFAKEADLKKVRSLAARVLQTEFERVSDGGKGITFVRKATSTEGRK